MGKTKVSYRTAAALLGVGLTFLTIILTSELLLLPAAFETPARMLYRIVFFLILPARIFVEPVIPKEAHTWPLSHFAAACIIAPILYWAAWRIARAVGGRVRGWRHSASASEEAGLTRRQFLVRPAMGIAAAAAVGVGGYAVLAAPQRLRVAEYTLPVRDLPMELDGLRIVHVTDTHYGPYTAMPYLWRAAAMANELQGDILFFTGDYAHQRSRTVQPGIKLLTRFKARLGAVAVLGNHDHWEGTEACQAAFAGIGIPLIDNARVFLTAEGIQPKPAPEHGICLAGVGDLWADEVRLGKALDGIPSGMPRLLLSHNPDVAEGLGGAGRVDCMFSGHTHGGQVSLPGVGAAIVPSRYGQKYAGGLCQGPHCPVIVSRGVGVTVLPVRFGVPPEIGLITLYRA